MKKITQALADEGIEYLPIGSAVKFESTALSDSEMAEQALKQNPHVYRIYGTRVFYTVMRETVNKQRCATIHLFRRARG